MASVDFTRRGFVAGVSCLPLLSITPASASESRQVEPQPFFASVKRALDTLAASGQPIRELDARKIAELSARNNVSSVAEAETILDRYVLARVTLNSDGIGSAVLGGADRKLVEQGWTSFLVRVSNPYVLAEAFDVSSGLSAPGKLSRVGATFSLEQRADLMDTVEKAPVIERLWLLAQSGDHVPLLGTSLEYAVVQLFSRNAGKRIGKLGFGAGAGRGQIARDGRGLIGRDPKPFQTQFETLKTRDVPLTILDTDGVGCMASLLIRDGNDHIYPPQVMRLAPDLAFQPHIYRANGETLRLPDGEYQILARRGPEYLVERENIRILGNSPRISVQLRRWVDPAKWGWYSGDTHIHAAGCAHYMQPTEGVNPETMIRHVRGEALSIGDILTWGAGWYHQKEFFSGRAISPKATLEFPDLQAANNTSLKPVETPKDGESLLRYDVEISGFPSSLSGHLVLLRLKEQTYPGTKLIEDWPSWNLPILKWAKAQGAVVGFGHCAAGMIVESKDLPNFEIPPFDSVGTNEAIVDVTHDACDFLSGCNGPPTAELNAWYHMLNCGYTLAMVGETDYPCLSPSFDARPGIGRSYVSLAARPTDDVGYGAWVDGLRDGKLYWGDGRTHFLQFNVNQRGSGKQPIALDRPGTVEVNAKIAALLEAVPSAETIQNASEEPWHIEHARIGKTRRVMVELIVNGLAVENQEYVADGTPRDIRFSVRLERSSWLALRVQGSGHTYPVFAIVGDKPVRASRRSAQWLRTCVDALWQEKHLLIRGSERSAAAEAYDHARRAYDRIIAESDLA